MEIRLEGFNCHLRASCMKQSSAHQKELAAILAAINHACKKDNGGTPALVAAASQDAAGTSKMPIHFLNKDLQ